MDIQPRKLKIGLDFDETFTEDVDTFATLVMSFKKAGHEVKFVTWRKPDVDNTDIENWASYLKIDVVYCSGHAKMKCYAADIWIDDSPYAVVCHARWAQNFGDKDDSKD